MLLLAVTLALAVQDSAGRAAPAVVPSNSYMDADAGLLVTRARAARQRNERLVSSYTALVTQRIGAGIHALSRDRMLYHQELAARIQWRRDGPSRIEVIGAREAVPVAARDAEVPDDLEDNVRWLVVNPAEDYLRLVGMDNDGFVYPLRDGGENDYRFATGDTTTITLPSGRDVRLLELRIAPRRADWRLISGSLWFDADSYGLVRAVFRPARPYEFRRDADQEDRKDVPSFINPTAEVKYVTLEYGLYESRWWMMRYAAVDAIAKLGSWAGMPLRFERTYSDYQVQGGTPAPAGSTFRPAGTVRRRERSGEDSARAEGRPYVMTGADSLRADSVRQAVAECVRRANEADSAVAPDSSRAHRRAVRVRVRVCNRRDESDSSLAIVIPGDSIALLSNPQLGPPILDMGDIISDRELQQLSSAIGLLPQRPWEFRPDLPVGAGVLIQNARYNRVEALSLGWSGKLDFGRLTLDGLARLGVADLEPNAELGLTRPAANATYRLGAYRRLAAANPDVEPFGVINSLTAFFVQRDDGEYFRTLGVELTGGNSNAGWWRWRVYAERQESASVETQFSVPHIFSSSNLFRPNIAAQPADLAGASVTLRGAKVLSRTLLIGGETTIDGATGDFEYGRGAATARLTVTPKGKYAIALEAAAGGSSGTVPLQNNFYLGGAATLRGYDGGVTAGPFFWRGRIEVGRGFPAFRVAAFSDAGWAGPRADFTTGRSLISAGLGASILDGLMRMDLGRAMRSPLGWRFDLYFDGAL